MRGTTVPEEEAASWSAGELIGFVRRVLMRSFTLVGPSCSSRWGSQRFEEGLRRGGERCEPSGTDEELSDGWTVLGGFEYPLANRFFGIVGGRR